MVSPVGVLYAGNLPRVEQLLVVYPKISGVVTPYYFCGVGWNHYYASGATDTLLGAPLAHQAFVPAMIQCLSYREQCLDRGNLVGGVTSYGTVRIADPKRALPFADDSCDWTNAPFVYLEGDPSWTLSAFAVVRRGYVDRSLPIEQPGPAHELVLRGPLSLLAEPAQSELYRGTGACLQFDGVAARVAIPYQAALAVTGNFTITAWIWPFALSFGTIIGRGNGSYRFRIQPDGSLWLLLNDGAGPVTAASPPGVVRTGMWQHVAVAVRFVLGFAHATWYWGGAIGATSTAAVGAASLGVSSIAASAGTGLSLGGETFGESLNGRMDEVQLWNRALTVDEIEAFRQREIAGDTAGLALYHDFNAGIDATSFDRSPNLANGTLTDGPQWVGSGEGGPNLAGRKKPRARGIIRHRELIWIDDLNQIGQFDGRPCKEVLLVTVGGVPSYTFHAAVSDLYASDPPDGTYDVDIAHSWIKFGGTRPNLTVLVDFRADTSGSGYAETTGTCARAFTEEAGVALDTIDDGGFGAIDILHPGPVGIGINGEDASFDDFILKLVHGVYGWRCSDISGRVTVGALDLSGPPVATIDGAMDIAAQGREPVDVGKPVKRIDVEYRRYEKPLNRSELAADILSESEIEDFGKEYRVYSTPAISTAKGAEPLVVRTCFDEEADAQRLAEILTPIFSGRPRSDLFTLSHPQHGFAPGMAATVAADLPGYTTGRRVVLTEIDVNEQTGVHRVGAFG